ncbi:MAG: radical SAM protein [Candidatus Uhrbacteria bacterium]
MRIQTFSIVVGTSACDGRCPFCVARMTGLGKLPKRGVIHRPNFEKACELARLAGTTTVLMTGKGEPDLYPDEITEYLEFLRPYRFPFIELQTNALEIGRLARDGVSRIHGLTRETLVEWRANGLNTIAISVVSHHAEHNRDVYAEDYPQLETTIRFLHGFGFTVRLCVMMQRGMMDTLEHVLNLIGFCKYYGVDQLTIRPIRKPVGSTHDDEAAAYVVAHELTQPQIEAIRDWVEANGTRLLSLMHGATVYDVGGQNVCLSDCLTVNAPKDGDDIRTLIFYSDGRLTYDWQHPGAVLLGPGRPAA